MADKIGIQGPSPPEYRDLAILQGALNLAGCKTLGRSGCFFAAVFYLAVCAAGLVAAEEPSPQYPAAAATQDSLWGWQALLCGTESLSSPHSVTPDHETLAYELAFSADLDSHPASALQRLLDQGVHVAFEPTLHVAFDPSNHAHLDAATAALARLSSAISRQDIRVVGAKGKLFLGFPTGDLAKTSLLWKNRSALSPLALRRDHPQARSIACKETKLPSSGTKNTASQTHPVAVCMSTKGCQKSPKEMLIPVLPIWIVFDRASKTPERLVING
ncbi:MAG: hypothetical protein ABJG04_05315 [Roseobacter sp.]